MYLNFEISKNEHNIFIFIYIIFECIDRNPVRKFLFLPNLIKKVEAMHVKEYAKSF